MSTLEEVKAAMDILDYTETSSQAITVLHCNSAYPTPVEDVNHRAISTIKECFPGITVGFSDHTVGLESSIAAVASGSEVIEKH